MSEVEDKLPLGSFTARVETDGIDIRQTVGLRQARASGEARTAAMMRSEAGDFLLADFLPQRQEGSGNAYDENNSIFAVIYMGDGNADAVLLSSGIKTDTERNP